MSARSSWVRGTRGGATGRISAARKGRVTPSSVVTVVAGIVVRGAVVVGAVVRRIVEEGAIVPKAHPHAARSVVAGHEVPDRAVEVPARVNEHVVRARRNVVPRDPDVFACAVVPIAIHPDGPGIGRLGLLDDHSHGLRGGFCSGSCGLGLLNDDHRLSLDLLGRALPLFDHDVRGRVVLGGDVVPRIAVMANDDISITAGPPCVAARPLVALRTRPTGHRPDHQPGGDC